MLPLIAWKSIVSLALKLISNFKLVPTRKHDLESLLYTLIYLFTGQWPYGEISESYATSKVRMIHQLENREKASRLASKLNISLAKLLCRNIEINNFFCWIFRKDSRSWLWRRTRLWISDKLVSIVCLNLNRLEKCKESEWKIDTIYDTQAIPSNSASIINIGSTKSGNQDDLFKNTFKFSEWKSDSGIFADGKGFHFIHLEILTSELGKSTVRKKSFFGKKNNDESESDSHEDDESELSESLYYTWKEVHDNTSYDSKKSLPSLNGWKVIVDKQYHLKNKFAWKEIYDWDKVDVTSFEEHKWSHSSINLPKSIVNYRD